MRWIATLIVASLVFVASAQDAEAQGKPRKFALLVAIDHYGAKYTPKVSAGQQWAALHGTVNDVSLLAAELEQRGFEVTMLTNAKATRKGISEAFKANLIDKTKAGRKDVVFFHYSGHGQQIPDDNGVPDEVDGYDESLVPFDNLGTHNYSNHLRDEQLGGLVKELAAKTPNVIISLDSCHSGTGTRGSLRVRGGPPVHPPAKARPKSADEGNNGMLQPVLTRGSGPKRHGYVLISATLPTQLAKEVEDPITKQNMGAFTWSLVRALRRARKDTTWQQLMDQVGVEVSSRVSDQNPQIEGDTDNLIFSGEWAASPTYYKVKPLDSQGLYPVAAGRLHGLTMGSVIGLYAPGSGKMDPKKPVVKAKVTKLEVGMAWVKPEGNARADTFKFGGRAIELMSQHTPNRMRVLVPKAAGALNKEVKGLKFAAHVPENKATDPRGNPAWDVQVSVASGKVGLKRVDGTTIPIPRGPEKPTDDTIDMSAADTATRIKQALKVEFRRKKILGLINDDPSSRAEVAINVKHVDAVATSSGPKITKVHGVVPKNGRGALGVGDIIQFELSNRSDRDLYVSIIELSADGSVDVIYPVEGMRNGENKLAKKEKRALKNVLFQMAPPSGPVTWKVIATEDDVDFRTLAMRVKGGSTRGASTRGANSPLAQLMEMAMDGTRAKPFGYAPAKLWGADAIQLRIK